MRLKRRSIDDGFRQAQRDALRFEVLQRAEPEAARLQYLVKTARLEEVLDVVDRDREANTSCTRQPHADDADGETVVVEQRSAAVSRIDAVGNLQKSTFTGVVRPQR